MPRLRRRADRAQKADFQRLGVLGDWEHPYKTMDFETEAAEIRALGRIWKTGLLYRGLKPVNWCIDCGSALAEAEVEYEDKTSPAIDVAFAAVDPGAVAEAFGAARAPARAAAVIWTTTPWTLPGNQAIAAHAEIEYELVDTERGALILAAPLREAALKRYGLAMKALLGRATGVALEGLKFRHPFRRGRRAGRPRRARHHRFRHRPRPHGARHGVDDFRSA